MLVIIINISTQFIEPLQSFNLFNIFNLSNIFNLFSFINQMNIFELRQSFTNFLMVTLIQEREMNQQLADMMLQWSKQEHQSLKQQVQIECSHIANNEQFYSPEVMYLRIMMRNKLPRSLLTETNFIDKILKFLGRPYDQKIQQQFALSIIGEYYRQQRQGIEPSSRLIQAFLDLIRYNHNLQPVCIALSFFMLLFVENYDKIHQKLFTQCRAIQIFAEHLVNPRQNLNVTAKILDNFRLFLTWIQLQTKNKESLINKKCIEKYQDQMIIIVRPLCLLIIDPRFISINGKVFNLLGYFLKIYHKFQHSLIQFQRNDESNLIISKQEQNISEEICSANILLPVIIQSEDVMSYPSCKNNILLIQSAIGSFSIQNFMNVIIPYLTQTFKEQQFHKHRYFDKFHTFLQLQCKVFVKFLQINRSKISHPFNRQYFIQIFQQKSPILYQLHLHLERQYERYFQIKEVSKIIPHGSQSFNTLSLQYQNTLTKIIENIETLLYSILWTIRQGKIYFSADHNLINTISKTMLLVQEEKEENWEVIQLHKMTNQFFQNMVKLNENNDSHRHIIQENQKMQIEGDFAQNFSLINRSNRMRSQNEDYQI